MPPITQAAQDQVVDSLVPLFLPQTRGDTQGDQPTARQHAQEALAAYGATNDAQMRLAALFIAFSLQALAALGRAAEPGLDAKTVLRLNGNANALNRAALQAHRALGRAQAGDTLGVAAGRSAGVSPHGRPATLPQTHPAAHSAFHPTLLEPAGTGPAVGLSRQQRRAFERQMRKVQLRQQAAPQRPAPAADLVESLLGALPDPLRPAA